MGDLVWALHGALLLTLGAALAQLLLNLRALPRLSALPGGAPPDPGLRVSVLIPARNEADRIVECLRGWRRQTVRPAQLLVLDDESTDGTAARARDVLAGLDWAAVRRGTPKPPGWSGKSYACHQLAGLARGDILLFTDADVVPSPQTLAALLACFARPGTDAVTVLPRHRAQSRAGRHLAPLQAWVLACFHPLWLAARRPRPWLTAANGQLLAVRREAYQAVGGHAAVWRSLAEDTELGRRLTAAGFRLLHVDGSDLVTCGGYETLTQCWHANAKNLFAILFRSYALAGAVVAWFLLAWAAPWAGFAATLASRGAATVAFGLEAALGLATRVIVVRRFGYRLVDSWSHPLLALFLAAMIAYSAWVHVAGRVRWRGREYAASTAGWADAAPAAHPESLGAAPRSRRGGAAGWRPGRAGGSRRPRWLSGARAPR